MAQIALRRVPDHLHQELRHAAERNRRSLNSEILARLEESVQHRIPDVEGLLERIRRRRKEIGELDLSEETLRALKAAGRP
jgi:ppGpp synthetase/RelA/SpoT-type nucleotidyltranferase